MRILSHKKKRCPRCHTRKSLDIATVYYPTSKYLGVTKGIVSCDSCNKWAEATSKEVTLEAVKFSKEQITGIIEDLALDAFLVWG